MLNSTKYLYNTGHSMDNRRDSLSQIIFCVKHNADIKTRQTDKKSIPHEYICKYPPQNSTKLIAKNESEVT